MEWVVKTLNHLLLIISNWVYTFIGWLYQVFIAVAKVNLFDRTTFKGITSRLYIIVAIAMLFIFAYQIILMIINPEDKKGTGQATKIVKETIISLVLIVLLPTIFNYLYIFQNNILDSNIIGKIIFGTNGMDSGNVDTSSCDPLDYDCTCNFNDFSTNLTYNFEGPGFLDGVLGVFTLGIRPFINNIQEASRRNDIKEVLRLSCEVHRDELSAGERGANSISPILLSAFYRPTKFTFDDCVSYLRGNDVSNITDDIDKKICVNYFVDYNMARYTGNIDMFVDDAYLREVTADSSKDNMKFDGLWALLAGGFAAWMFLCYAMEIGVRVAKLGVLQLISPIPVMMRIIPKQKEAMYDKWFKHVVNTYTDVFIRLIIIFFSLFAISLVPNVIKTLFSSMGASSDNFLIRTLSSVFVILGILKFAQDAPGLIKEFFGDSGRFALKSPSRQIKENKLGGAALGMAGGAVTSTVGNLFNAGRNIKNAEGAWGKTKAALRLPFSPFSGAIGGAYRGMKHGYGAEGFKDLRKRVAEAKYETDEAFERGLWGGIKHKAAKIGSGFADFGAFISGTGATDFRAQAVEDMLTKNTRIKDIFANAVIKGIESAQVKMSEDYNNNKDVNVRGVKYSRTEDGYWHGSDGSKIPHQDVENADGTVTKGMNTLIKDAFDEMKRNAYAERYYKNKDGFKELSDAMVKSLSDNMSKLGTEFSTKFFKKLNGEGLNLNVNTIDELSSKIGELQKSGQVADFAALYNINDAIEGLLKDAKVGNAAAASVKKDK